MPMDDIIEVIRGRRSVRSFRPDPVPGTMLRQLLEAMRWAPSAGNAQPIRVQVVLSAKRRRKLAEAALGQGFIATAPCVFVVIVDLAEADRAYGQRGRELYCLQDSAAAIQNLLLAAHALGLGTCWVGAFLESAVVETLAIPPTRRPVAIIPLGWPAQIPAAPSRKPLDEVVIGLDEV